MLFELLAENEKEEKEELDEEIEKCEFKPMKQLAPIQCKLLTQNLPFKKLKSKLVDLNYDESKV